MTDKTVTSTRKRFVVAKASELEPGRSRCVSAGGREIALFNVGGTFHALANKCPHESGPLSRGAIVGLSIADVPGTYKLERPGEFVRCPWHGWEFDITSGRSICNPHRMRVRTYEVTIEADEDPSVEAYPVTVEHGLIVLHV